MDVIVCSNEQNPTSFTVELDETLDLSKLYQVAIKSISIATPSNDDLPAGRKLGLIYSNLVPPTNVNHEKRRFMGIFPFGVNEGYNHHEFINPTYRTVSLSAMIEMEFDIRNVKNEHLEFSNEVKLNFPTVIALHFREI